MKKSISYLVVASCALLGASAGNLQAAFSSTNEIPLQIAITATIQTTNSGDFGPTNSSGVAVAHFKTFTAKIVNQDILNLIEAEFGTNFPTGALIAYNANSTHLDIVDENGNFIMDASSHQPVLLHPDYRFALSNSVAGGSSPTVIKGKATQHTFTTNTAEVVTEYAPDYGIYYSDSAGNDFHLDGLIVVKANALVTSTNTLYKTFNFKIAGNGGGTFFNPADGQYDDGVFMKAQAIANGSGIIQ